MRRSITRRLQAAQTRFIRLALAAGVLLVAPASTEAEGWRYAHDLTGNLVIRAANSAVAPEIIAQPQPLIVAPGELASFSVVMADTSTLAYQWRFNSTNLLGQTNDALLLFNVTTNSQGPYSVVITNSSGSVTSIVAQLYLDSDGDGLPDSWELTYFGNLTSQRSGGDADGDGSANLHEFFDGTNPTNNASRNLRLTILSDGGSVAAAPTKLNYTNGESVTLTATPFPPNSFYNWTGDLIARTNPAGLTMNSNKTVRANFTCAPATAGLVAWWRGENDASDFIGGHAGTFYSGNNVVAPSITVTGMVGGAFVHFGTNHIRVPDASDLRPAQITLEAWVFPTVQSGSYQTVIARGSASNDDDTYYLGVLNGVAQFWTRNSGGMVQLPGGSVALNQWTHLAATFDGSTKRLFVNGVLVGTQTGLGALTYDAAPVPVTIGSDWTANAPSALFNGLLDEVSLFNRALSPTEINLLYVANVAGKCTNRTVFVTAPQFADATQGVAYTQQVMTVLGTLPVSFSLSAGSLPSGLTLSSSGLVSGVPATAGSNVFAVLATDAAGLSTELICGLQVLPAIVPVPAMPASLVAWWHAENNALDAVGTNHGTLSNGVSFAAGEVGQAFLFNGTNQEVKIPAAPALNVGAGNGLTLEAWIKPASLVTQSAVIEWNDGAAAGAHFWINVAFSGQGGPGCTYINLRDINSADHYFFSPIGLLNTNVWQHVAATYDPGSGIGKLFVNGSVVASANLGFFVPRTTADLHLGYRPGSPLNGYAGLLDEPALFNRTLSTNEIAAIYNAGPLGKVSVGPYLNTPPTLPDAVVGTGYTQTITSVRGAAPVTYTVAGGALPPGLNLNSSGLLSGTPTTAGGFNFTVRATDAVALSNSQFFTLQVYAKIPPPPGLVGWWRAETNPLDSIGTNNGVLMNGATFTVGKAGQSFLLDGVNDSVDIPDAPSLRPASVTLEAWALFTATGTRVLLGKPVGSGFSDSYQIYISGGNLGAVVGDAAGVGPPLSIPFSPEFGTWYHFAYTFDDASKQQALYLNGSQVASGGANKTIGYDSQPLLLGRDTENGTPNFFFPGRIDEAALYNRALSAGEIASIYNAGLGGKTASGPYFSTPPSLPDAVAGLGYTQTVATLRGTLPVGVAVVGGAMPGGLTLSSTGTLSGTPANPGSFSFTVRATDGAALTADQVFTLQVLPKLSPPAGLVGWWRAENNALDAVGTSDGTPVNGTAFAAGNVGQAFSLDGVDDIVDIPDVPALRPASLTLETWVLFFSSGGNQHIIAKPLGTGTADSFVLWYENGNLRGGVSDISGGFNLTTVPFTPVLGRWYHVAFTFDDDSKEQWLYLDGIAVATGTSNRRIGYDDHPVQLGGDIDNGNLAWMLQGRIDEAAMYNRALGATEIAALYNAGSGGKTIAGPYINTPPQMPPGVVGRAYTQIVNSVRGTAPITYALVGGALPGGVTLSPSGTLSGTPNTLGRFSFIVRATDATGLSGDQAFTLEVFPLVPPPAGLVSWWRAENNGLDSAGANHGLVTNGVTYAAGEVGRAFSMDGFNDYVQVADAPSLRPASVTLETWVLFHATGTRVLLGKPVGGGTSDSYQIYLSGGTLGAFVGDAAGAGTALTIPFAPVLGRWYHVAYTFDDASLQHVLYLDGLTVASGLGSKRIGYDTQPVLLGCDTENGVRAFFLAGRMDEAAIYHRALRADEVAALYNSGAAGKTTVGPYFSTAPPLPDGVVARAYSQAITAVRGAPPVSYALVAGALPDGLGLSPGGVLSGLPTTAGENTFVIRATDSASLFAEQFFTLEVFAPVAVTNGLLAWWKGDQNAQDSAGTNHGTMLGGATFAAGKVNAAFDLDGTSAYVAISNSAWLNPTGPFSVEVWIKASAQQFSPDGRFLIVDKSHGFTDSTGWALQGNPDGTVSFFFGLGGGGSLNFIGASTPGSLRDDRWHHLAGVFNGAQILLYQDGRLVGSTSNTNLPVGNARHVQMGRSWGGGSPGRHFHGLMDEVSFYGRALSEDEVIAIYNAGPAGKVPISSIPPLVLRPSLQGGAVVISFDAVLNQSYTVQQTSNLLAGWTTFGNITATQTNVVFSDAITNAQQRFFRVLTPGN